MCFGTLPYFNTDTIKWNMIATQVEEIKIVAGFLLFKKYFISVLSLFMQIFASQNSGSKWFHYFYRWSI